MRLALKWVPRPLLIRISYWVRPALAWYLRGNRFTDPINGKSYRKFLPYGYGDRQRPNALSPGTNSLERHRLLWLYLKEETNFFTEPTYLLHVAPEQCFYGLFKKQKNLNYLTADLFSPLADVKMDIHHIQYPDHTFDAILCNHVLEHVDDDLQCMRELHRVLKPGGWAIMQVPLDPTRKETFSDPSITDQAERERIFGQYDHVRVYGTDYPQRLRSAGFEVEEVDYSKKLSADAFERFRLPQHEMLYVCRK